MKANVRVLAALAIGLSILGAHAPTALAAPAWIQQTAEIAPPPGADPEFAFTHLHAVSCGAVGACTAVGSYEDSESNSQVMAVSKVAGKWGSAQKVALPLGHHDPTLNAISCSSAGNCVAVGRVDLGSTSVGLIVEQKNGAWGASHDVPGPVGADWTWLTAVDCAADGSCTAVGGYEDAGADNRPLAISESGGVWGSAITVQMPAGASAASEASLRAVSCAAANSCSALGSVWEDSGAGQTIVANKSGGTWGVPLEIGSPAGSSPFFGVGISCGAPGSCLVGGSYEGSDHLQHPAVAEAVGSVWGGATAIPLLMAGTYAGIQAVSCPAAGNCAVVGYYEDSFGDDRVFRAESNAGAWSLAAELPTPRTSEVSPYRLVGLGYLDCPAVGSCAAVGFSFWRGVTLLEQGGSWAAGEWVRLPANSQSEESGGFESLSCGSPGSCSAVGNYTDDEGMNRAMVLDTVEAFDVGIPEEKPKAPPQEQQPGPQPGAGGSSSGGGQSPPAQASTPGKPGGKNRSGNAHCRKGFKRKVDHGKAKCVKKKREQKRNA